MRWCNLIPHFALFIVFLLNASDVQDVVASDQNLAKTSRLTSIDIFFGIRQLHIHVSIDGDEEAFVFMAPLELDNHWLSGEGVEERFRVDGHRHCDCVEI